VTTYADLSPYSYWTADKEPDSMADLNVGWLGTTADFDTGPVAPAFLIALRARPRTNQTRGLHFCGLCERPASGDLDELPAGSAEIHVKGSDGTVYGAPTLITHYIEAHNYRPPQVFVDAVLSQVR
jgi:hypothetical protein